MKYPSLRPPLLCFLGFCLAMSLAVAADGPPQVLKIVEPKYPGGMAKAGLEGEVVVEFIVDSKGKVRNAFAVQSNNPAFERAAIRAVEQWTFKPGIKNGRAVNTRRVQVPVKFSVNAVYPQQWRVNGDKPDKTLPDEYQWAKPPAPFWTVFSVYPFDQLAKGIEGKAHIAYTVGPNGKVTHMEVLESTTPEMGLASLAMIDSWQFSPAMKQDGTVCSAMLDMVIEFSATDTGDVPLPDEAKAILLDLTKDPESIVKANELDQPLRPFSQRAPVYPTTLSPAGKQGSALIEFFVDKNGDAQLPRIVSSSAPEFGYAAAQAVVGWRFDRPMKKGKPVAVRVRVPVNFLLK